MRNSVSAGDLVEAIVERGGTCRAAGPVDRLPGLVAEMRSDEDLVMVLGAGDVDAVVEQVVSVL